MSQNNIQLHIIIDGIKPKLLAETFELNCQESEEGYVNSIYSYKNFGVEEIIQAVKVLKESNYTHSYYFAPYEATPQVYYLHDHFTGSSMCGFPDLLFHAWYNFIIDFDLQKKEFEWVKYSKETGLNKTRNLAKLFLNFGYFLKPGEKYKELTTEEIKSEIDNWNTSDHYTLNTSKVINTKIWEILEYPSIFTIKFEIEQLKRKVADSSFEDLYGNKLPKEIYFSLIKGLISPKIWEMLAYDRHRKNTYYLKSEIEKSLIQFNLGLIDKGYNILKDTDNEDKKIQEDLGPFDIKSTKIAEFDNEVANFITSDTFNNTIQESSDDLINTLYLVIKELAKYIDENDKATKANSISKSISFLQQNQIWPYMLLHLWKEINIWKDGSLTYFGNFYSKIDDWRHDYQYLIILLLFMYGFPFDMNLVKASSKETPLSTLDNAINLVCCITTLIDVEFGEPWEAFELEVDENLKNFTYLCDLIKDGIRNYTECVLFKTVMNKRLISHKEYETIFNKIKFKKTRGRYFATILKSILQYNFPSDSETTPKFEDINWDWYKYLSNDHFKENLKETLILWDSVYKIATELSEKSKQEYISIAFSNGDYVLKTKIKELQINLS